MASYSILAEVQQPLNDYIGICSAIMPSGLPPLHRIQHCIDLIPGSSLPNLAHYKMCPKEQEILHYIIEDLLQKELIQPSMSSCSAPALLVLKKNSSWSICVDSQAINKITIKYRFHMPRFEDLIDHLSKATIFSKLDLRSSYHQNK